MTIKQFSDEELRQELAQREKTQRELATPQPIEHPDLEKLRRSCAEYIAGVKTGWVDDDLEHYIFEAAMKAIYGDSVWEWINSKGG